MLQQQGELQVSVRAFLADGVRLASGASWLQRGSATISAGHLGHDRDFSLSTIRPAPCRTTFAEGTRTHNRQRRAGGGQCVVASDRPVDSSRTWLHWYVLLPRPTH